MGGLLRVLLLLAAGYFLLILVVFLLQRRLLYFPNPTTPSPAQLADAGQRHWPSDERDSRGFVSVEQPASPQGTIVVFHGNAGAAWQRGYYVDALQPLGYRVILAEYPGYGGRPGEPSEAALVADARETLRRVYAEYGAPVYLWGESLGSAVVAAVAAQPSAPIAGLVLLTPWDNLPDLAQSIYPFLPVRWLLHDRYDSVRNLAQVALPVAVVIAEHDEIIPPERAQRLYAALSTPKQRWILPGAGHNTLPVEPYHPWWREVMIFLAGS